MFYKLTVFILLISAFSILFVTLKNPKYSISYQISSSKFSTQNSPKGNSTFIEPIAEFKSRITKKPFGIYVSPKNSPVHPEKFTGYHTGVDVEYEDNLNDVPTFAINDGEIAYSGYVNGYGGVIVLRTVLNEKRYMVLYGHLNTQSMVRQGSHVAKGQTLGILGKGYSQETDGERKHLHFSIYNDDSINFHGYVSTKKELESWNNPLDFY
jgi:murein DD-endopeptidase MepM/ murein hydrolase activator NlpD